MIRFDESFNALDPVHFVPLTVTTSLQGAPLKSYVGSGTLVSASVQPRSIRLVEPDGTVRSATVHIVYLLDDPAALNSGNGVRTDDAFTWRGLKLVCQGPATPDGGRDCVWRCECLAVG